jgi:hypothetical protein
MSPPEERTQLKVSLAEAGIPLNRFEVRENGIVRLAFRR